MLRGLLTNENYEECLKAGFCKDHMKELEIKDDKKSFELQRKALLYIRLQVFAPLLFNKPFSSDKMKILFSKCKYFHDRENKNSAFKEAIMILDSVVVYTLCHFSKVCCAGIFYSSKPKISDDPTKQRIIQLLNKKILEESDIGYFSPFLTENFKDFEKNLVRVSYVTTLLCVRNVTMNLKLRHALNRLHAELHGVSREGEKWKIIGNDSYKEERYEEAVNAFTSAINYNPYCVPLLKNRAQAYLKIRQYDSAALDYYMILVLNPLFLKYCYMLSFSLSLCNRNYESFLIAEYALEKLKDFKAAKDFKLFNMLKMMREISESNLERTNPDGCSLSNLQNILDVMEDIPDFIEAADSETETQDVPDLMDASDSDESDSEVLNKKNRNLENKKPVEQQKLESCFKDEKQEKRDNLCSTLKEASSTLLDGCALMAIPKYHSALNEIKTYPEVYNYEECDLMCIKYAYGCALCKSKSYDDLQKAIRIFKEITEEHNTFMFPAAQYGIALAYYKLNWHKEALCYLKAVIDIIQKEIPFKECTWPGLTVLVEETKPEHLKVLVNNLIKECENPPPPDAVCRFDKCSLRASIYLNDPDFKGFYFIQCSEQCCLQYHPQCWKILRSAKQCTDKDFLEQMCFTPDCDGTICKIQNISKDGNIEKEFSLTDTKKLAKQKRAKVPKKAEVKEEKKRKRKDSSSKSEPAAEENACAGENQVEMEVNESAKEAKSDSLPEDVPLPSVLSASAEPFIMLKKEKFENEQPSKVSTKPKEHKKVKSNTFTIDEFLQNNQAYGNDYAQRLSALRANNQNIIEGSWTNCNQRVENLPTVPFEDPCNQNPFEVKHMQPSLAPSYASQLSAERQDSTTGDTFYDVPTDLYVIQTVKKEIFSFFKDLLQKHGPLHINDPIIVNELKDFPPFANKLIADCDGIGGFLKQNIDFALVDEKYVCVVADVVAAYEKLSGDSKINALPTYPAYSSQGDPDDNNSFNSSYLNPDAKEYMPPSSSHASTESVSSDAAAENIHRNSPELISAISKLRQPLQVENGAMKREMASGDAEHRDKPETGVPNASSYFGDVPKNASLQEKVAALLEKFTAYVDLYFSDEMNQYRSYVDECMMPYSIVKIPMRNNACAQTENNEVEKVSCGTMVTDEELSRLKEITCLLTDEKQELLKRMQLLKEERDSALSSAEKNQIEGKEFENLKKEWSDLKVASYNQKTKHQKREQELSTEIANLLDRLKSVEEVNSSQKFEADEIISNNESMKTKVKELEGTVSVLQDEKQSMKQSLDIQIDTLTANVKTLEMENVEVKERAKYAEHLLLCLKKSEYLKRIDMKTSEAALRMKQLKDGIASFSATMPPLLIRNLEVLLTQIKECIVKLQDIRRDFIIQMDEQINQVNNGISLKNMQPINVTDLPEIPSWTNTMLNAQTPCWTSQIQMLSSASNSMGPKMPYPPSKLPEASSLPMRQPSPLMKIPPQNPVIREDGAPPLPLSQSKLAHSVHNLYTACNAPVLKPQVVDSKTQNNEKDSKSMLGAVSKEPVTSAAASVNAGQSERKVGASSLELDYNVKKFEAKKTVPSKVSQENLHHEPKNSYEKLLHKLHMKFPDYTQAQLMDFVKAFREQRKGKLSGLSMDCIINEVGLLIAKSKMVTPTPFEVSSRLRPNPSMLVNKSLCSSETNPKRAPVEKPTEKKCPWAKSDGSRQWSGNNIDEGCIICYEDMSGNPYRVDCGHCFHYKCIKEWLSKKSDCPICRVHLLLPDDYPELK